MPHAVPSSKQKAKSPPDASRVTRSTSVFEKLLSLILRGEWKEGERIHPERELSHELGVGRASLREALKALELIGMIESRVGDGTFVCERSTFLSRPLLWAITGNGTTRVDELVESRLVLECEMAAFAATRANSDDLNAIEEGVRLMQAGLGNPTALLESDLKFHLAIAKAAHNQILLNAVQMIRSLMRQWMLVTLHVPGVEKQVLSQHRQILNAIRAKDAQLARNSMRLHLEEMGGLLIRIKSAART
ncbi:MAG TPA: FadR/GntR family transcriptional regulator [Bryobacteraceae bacterium]|nr:FadR/GntR family transcriptional regulator [Bryobacteraceae bacterium]